MSFELINYQITLNRQPLFSPMTCAIEASQVLTLIGRSGSGKSTLLSDLSGALAPDFQRTGKILLNGVLLNDVSISERQVGLLFQDDLLFPHLNVLENLVFGLPSTLSKSEKTREVSHALKAAELTGFETRDIATLSGGQKARISLLRTLLSRPALILLDEPFSKLDHALRAPFRQWVFDQLSKQAIPAVLVTHDPDDIPTGSTIIELEAPHA